MGGKAILAGLRVRENEGIESTRGGGSGLALVFVRGRDVDRRAEGVRKKLRATAGRGSGCQ